MTCRLPLQGLPANSLLLWVFQGLTYIPKFHCIKHYPKDIREFGMTDLYSTGFKECANKPVKHAARKTNSRPENLTSQVPFGNVTSRVPCL